METTYSNNTDIMKSANGYMDELRIAVLSKKRILLLQLFSMAAIIILGSLYIQYIKIGSSLGNKEYELYAIFNEPQDINTIMKISVIEAQMNFFDLMFVVMGCIATSLMFGGLGSKEGRISLLMTPTSAWTKFCVQWGVYVLGFVVAFLVTTITADLLRAGIFRLFSPEEIPVYTSWDYISSHWYYFLSVQFKTFKQYLFLSSLFMVGTVLWPKNSFIKSLTALVVLGIGLFVWCLIWNTVFNSDTTDMNLNKLFGGYYSVAKTMTVMIFVVVNWTITYLRLKETDIVKHV